MVVIKKKGLRRKIKSCFVGISQANRASLEKAPRWAKILSKKFPNQDMLGLCYTPVSYTHLTLPTT